MYDIVSGLRMPQKAFLINLADHLPVVAVVKHPKDVELCESKIIILTNKKAVPILIMAEKQIL